MMSVQVLPEEKVPEERAGTLSQPCVSDAYNSCSPSVLNFENGAVFMSSTFLKSLCPPSPGRGPGGPVSGTEGTPAAFGFSVDVLSDRAGVFSSFIFFISPSTSGYFCQALGEWNR